MKVCHCFVKLLACLQSIRLFMLSCERWRALASLGDLVVRV